jgi:hypothetical protein
MNPILYGGVLSRGLVYRQLSNLWGVAGRYTKRQCETTIHPNIDYYGRHEFSDCYNGSTSFSLKKMCGHASTTQLSNLIHNAGSLLGEKKNPSVAVVRK